MMGSFLPNLMNRPILSIQCIVKISLYCSSKIPVKKGDQVYKLKVHYLPFMKNVHLSGMLIIVIVVLIIAGCTQPAVTPSVTPTPSPTPTTPTNTSQSGMGIPGPVSTLPPESNLEFQITANGNTANPLMYVAIMGGTGMTTVPEVEVTLTKPDGTSETQVMTQPFYSGKNVQFSCSTNRNRIEIWVTAPTVGKVKVYDEIVPFQSINP